MIYEEELTIHWEHGEYVCMFSSQGEEVVTTGKTMDEALILATAEMQEKLARKEKKIGRP